jgi:hypothetical protein
LHESIIPLGVEEFSRLYIGFHNLLFPDDRLDDSTLWDLVVVIVDDDIYKAF